MGRWLIAIGFLFVVAGLLWPFLEKFGLGRLPGDIVIKGEHFRFFLPLGSSLLVSVVLSVVISIFFWFLKR